MAQGGVLTPQMQAQRLVENLSTFRRYNRPVEHYQIPEISENRKLTDVAFLIAFAICFVIMSGLLIYGAGVKGDIRRFTNGYDSCGNVCGIKNDLIDGLLCSGQDMTDKPYYSDGRCVSTCPNSSENSDCRATEWKRDLGSHPDILGFIIGLSVIISIAMLLWFRYNAASFVWSMIILTIVAFAALTGLFWYLYSNSDTDESASIVPAICFTFLTIFLAIIFLILKERIKLIISLLKETGKIVFSMKLLMLQPFLTLLAQCVALILFVYITILLVFAGDFQEVNGKFDYYGNGTVYFAIFFNSVMFIWTMQFILGCQHVVIAGAVAAGFFNKDKLTLLTPVASSFYNLVRFHLGSVAFGSFAITAVQILKAILRALANNRNTSCIGVFLLCCLRPIENLIRYLTSMGYVMIGMHGQSLCRSGVRAVNLVIMNCLTAIAVNNVGEFVFFTAKLAITALAVGLGAAYNVGTYKNEDVQAIYLGLGAVFAFCCAHCVFVVFEIGLDTVFLCYCEDQQINDGMINPYYSTLAIQKYLTDAKRFEDLKNKKKK